MPYPGGCNLQRGKLPGGKRFFRPAQTYWEYPAFLKSQAPHYKGEAYFVEAEAVCDNGILTANGFGALELAKEILRLLKFRSEQELAEWYAWNKFGLYSPGHKGRTPSGL